MSENNDLKEILKRIEDIEDNQKEIEKTLKKLQKDVKNIQEDIYIDDEDECDNNENDEEAENYDEEECEFEITCPYCGYEFIANDDMKGKDKIKCPKCQKTIELDWNMCDENCEHCHHCKENQNLSVAENEDDSYKNEPNNEDDM